MDKETIQYRLWHSLEMHVLRRDLIMYLITMGLFLLMTWDDHLWGAALLIDCLAFGPFVVFCLWRAFQIFRGAEGYVFYKTTLSRFQQKFPLKMMYFTVVLEEPDGSKLIENTHAIFACHGIMEPLVSDYVNSEVTVALNKRTGMVVVIG